MNPAMFFYYNENDLFVLRSDTPFLKGTECLTCGSANTSITASLQIKKRSYPMNTIIGPMCDMCVQKGPYILSQKMFENAIAHREIVDRLSHWSAYVKSVPKDNWDCLDEEINGMFNKDWEEF
jgi:hypothetical protein